MYDEIGKPKDNSPQVMTKDKAKIYMTSYIRHEGPTKRCVTTIRYVLYK